MHFTNYYHTLQWAELVENVHALPWLMGFTIHSIDSYFINSRPIRILSVIVLSVLILPILILSILILPILVLSIIVLSILIQSILTWLPGVVKDENIHDVIYSALYYCSIKPCWFIHSLYTVHLHVCPVQKVLVLSQGHRLRLLVLQNHSSISTYKQHTHPLNSITSLKHKP